MQSLKLRPDLLRLWKRGDCTIDDEPRVLDLGLQAFRCWLRAVVLEVCAEDLIGLW